jgi:hypothetical protein
MKSIIRALLVVAVAVTMFSVPAVADDGGDGGFVCYPFICK